MKIALLVALFFPALSVLAEDTVHIAEEIAPTAATASASFPGMNPGTLLGKAGMTGDRHDNHPSATTMWHTPIQPAATAPAPGLPDSPAWVRFDFAEPRTLSQICIWNHNQAGLTNRGFRQARLYGSTDGTTWIPLGKVFELAQGGDLPVNVALETDRSLKAVILAAVSNHGGDCYGLSHVRFELCRDMPAASAPFPTALECEPKPIYRHRADGKPGREVEVKFAGVKLFTDAEAGMTVDGGPSETVRLKADPRGISAWTALLPDGVAVDKETQVTFTLKSGGKTLSRKVAVPAKRQWTVYIYPHSHVDIGYTNTHDNIEFIHKQNLLTGIRLANETAGWPEGSRYVWNPEVTWPIERFLAEASPEDHAKVIAAIREGKVGVDAGYINDNTSVACDEELFSYVAYKHGIEKETGVKVDSLVQVDVPGMSWGVVPMAAANGIRYILAFHNGGDRTGHTNDLNQHPFWWESPDGKSRVLFFQPGNYALGAGKCGQTCAHMLGQRDPEKLRGLLQGIRTADPRASFPSGHFMAATAALEEREDYPYDIFAMSWSLTDNNPVDADLPEAVRSWNAEYAYPHVVIASGHTIMSEFEKKYGDQLPVRRGDFTEYWTDGLGSAAKQTGMNRASKERIIQADTLWSMLQPGTPAPRAEFDEAWRNIVLGSEHTWAYIFPNQKDMMDAILKVKFGYFQKAEDSSKELLHRALAPLAAAGGNKIAVFNNLSWGRTEVVTLPADQSIAGDGVRDEAGTPVPSQRLSTGELVFLASDVPALGAKNYVIGGTTAESNVRAVSADGLVLDNGLVRATLDPKSGDIASLILGGREFVDKQASCGVNAYRYLHGGDSGDRATGPTEVKITPVEKGPLIAAFRVESKAEGCNSLVRTVRLVAGSAQVEMDDQVDKLPITAKEGVHFGFAFDLPGAKTRMDIPWGVAEVEKDQFKEANRNWICFQRWLDVSNDEAGVVWSSLDAPTFEYGAMTANIIGSALGSPAWIRELKPSYTIYSWALNNHWHTNFPLSQEGKILFRYRLLPHVGGFDAAAANRFGTAQAQPLVVTPVKGKVELAPPVKFDNPRVAAVIVRSEVKGTTLRLRSLSDKEEKVNLAFPSGKSREVNMAPWGVASVEIER